MSTTMLATAMKNINSNTAYIEQECPHHNQENTKDEWTYGAKIDVIELTLNNLTEEQQQTLYDVCHAWDSLGGLSGLTNEVKLYNTPYKYLHHYHAGLSVAHGKTHLMTLRVLPHFTQMDFTKLRLHVSEIERLGMCGAM